MKKELTKKALHIFVYGKVQGVGFRAWTKSLAKSIKLTGWVRNTEKANCVEIFIEGTSVELNEFTKALKTEHPYAHVDSITKNEMKPINYKQFKIER